MTSIASLGFDKTSWTRVRLADVAAAVTSRVPDPRTSGYERYISSSDIGEFDFSLSDWGSTQDYSSPANEFRDGDYLFVRRSLYGSDFRPRAPRASFAGVCSGDIITIRETDAIANGFLIAVLYNSNLWSFVRENATGSITQRIKWRQLADFEFDLPPLDQQGQIANLLWALETESASQMSLNAALGQCSEATFESRAGTFKGKTVATETLLLEGPRNGISIPAHDAHSGFPTVTLAAIRDGEFVPEGNLKWVPVERTTIEQFLVQDGDFFVVRGNGNRDLVARGGMARRDTIPDDCFYPDLLIRLRFDPTKVVPEFAAAQWNSRQSHRALLQVAKTTNGTYKINGKDVRNHRMWIPSREEQLRVVAKIEGIAAVRNCVAKELRSLEQLRAAVLSEVWG